MTLHLIRLVPQHEQNMMLARQYKKQNKDEKRDLEQRRPEKWDMVTQIGNLSI